jgi:predicted RNase H-like nuclease (RuvC/YqgF family)
MDSERKDLKRIAMDAMLNQNVLQEYLRQLASECQRQKEVNEQLRGENEQLRGENERLQNHCSRMRVSKFDQDVSLSEIGLLHKQLEQKNKELRLKDVQFDQLSVQFNQLSTELDATVVEVVALGEVKRVNEYLRSQLMQIDAEAASKLDRSYAQADFDQGGVAEGRDRGAVGGGGVGRGAVGGGVRFH